MGRPVKNIRGQHFGSLEVIGFAGIHTYPSGRTVSKWLCRCLCGKTTTIILPSLRSDASRTCGCRNIDRGKSTLRHLYPLEYGAFLEMWNRCTNPKHKAFKYYGGRGICVSPVWRSFDQFIHDVGPRPSGEYSLDRFPNKDGDYEQGNVRWSTQHEQTRNMRSNIMITHNDVTLCLSDWAKNLGLPRATLSYRYREQWTKDEMFSLKRFGKYHK
jgi:hypothetical protein